MNESKLEEVFDRLISEHTKKKTRMLIKAQAEIDAIQREDAAYYDGVSDAINEIKALLTKSAEGEKNEMHRMP